MRINSEKNEYRGEICIAHNGGLIDFATQSHSIRQTKQSLIALLVQESK